MGYLTQEFLNKYTGNPFTNKLGEFVYLRTYSAWIESQNRRETWKETVTRVVEYSLSLDITKRSLLEKTREAEKLFDLIYNLKIFPAGRTLWLGGRAASKKFPAGNFNCGYITIDSFQSFVDAFYMLMVGAGIGFRVLFNDIEKLPVINPHIQLEHDRFNGVPVLKRNEYSIIQMLDNKTYKITVGDSKEGWRDALNSFFTICQYQDIHKIIINYDHIRNAGEKLKTFGGTASGHIALQEMFSKLHTVMSQKTILMPIDALDIMDIIGESVVVGGVRRSSLACLFEINDKQIMEAKYDLWIEGTKNYGKNWRSMSNNSIFFTEKPALEKIKEILLLNKNNGEPGLLNAESANKKRENFNGVNACLTGDTLVLTKDGHFPIKDLVGKTTEVWDGNNWKRIDNFRITAENQDVYSVKLYNGQNITATEYHTFILKDGTTKKLYELEIGDVLKSHNQLVHGNIQIKSAYAKGFLVGDGSFSDHPILNLYFPKYVCENRLINSILESPVTNTYGNTVANVSFGKELNSKKHLSGLSARKIEFADFCNIYKEKMPKDFLNWTIQSKLDFIAGVMDADGTASDTKKGFMYQITSIHKQWLLDFQLLLQSIGVYSRISNATAEGIRDFGEDHGGEYYCKQSYRLTISQISSKVLASLVNFERLISFSEKKITYELKNKSFTITDIEFSHIAEKVYCCTVNDTHSFSLSNGVLTGNCFEILLDSKGVCNLTTVNLTSFIIDGKINKTELCEAVRQATRIGLRQTNVTMELPEWDKIQKRDRLVGVSLTGVMDFVDILKISTDELNKLLVILKECANKEADNYSREMKINRPLLVTTIKPEGTISQLPVVSSGIHRSFASYYIRRIRITSHDPLAKVMLLLGYPIYPENGQGMAVDAFSNLSYDEQRDELDRVSTWVIEFPVKTEATSMAYDEPIESQFQRYLDFMKHYVDHNASVTLYVGDDEWDKLADLIYQHWDEYVAVSFLPKNTAAYPLMPYETITKEEYEKRLKAIPDVDLTMYLQEFEKIETDNLLLDDACAGGNCPVR